MQDSMQANPIPELRDLRKEIERCRELMRRRDELIRTSVKRYPQRRIAQAAGVSQSRVSKIASP